MPAEKKLEDAFYETLKDVYFAEKQALKACKKSAKNAHSPELKQAFEHHAEETSYQIERLQQIFQILGKPARTKTCEAMQGIVAEMEEDLGDFGGTSAGDAVIIGCGQAIEHYEIARYGTLKTWAEELGQEDVAHLLEQTLREEKKADALLSRIAEEIVNEQAHGGRSYGRQHNDSQGGYGERKARGRSASSGYNDDDRSYRSSGSSSGSSSRSYRGGDQDYQDRDSQGRFMSHQDEDQGRGSYRSSGSSSSYGSGSSRSRYDDHDYQDRDSQGRFKSHGYDNSDYDRSYRSSSNSPSSHRDDHDYQDRDSHGRFTSSSHEDDDDDRSYRSSHHGSGGQGQVRDPQHDRRLKQNRDDNGYGRSSRAH